MNPAIQRLTDPYKQMMVRCIWFDSTTIPAEHDFKFEPNTHYLVEGCNLQVAIGSFNEKIFKPAFKQWCKVISNSALRIFLNNVEFATIPLYHIPTMNSCFPQSFMDTNPRLVLCNKYPLLIPVSSHDVLHVAVVPLRKIKPLKNIQYTVSFQGLLMTRPRTRWELAWFKFKRWVGSIKRGLGI